MKRYLNTFWTRLAIVLLTTGLCVWFFTVRNWLWVCISLLALAWAVWSFYRLYTYYIRQVSFLLDAIENDDPAIHFYERMPDKDISKVNVMLNRIALLLRNVKLETAQREKYYELIMDFVETGIVVLDDKGSIYQSNRKAFSLLELRVLTHIRQLSQKSETLEKVFAEAVPGQQMQVEYPTRRGMVNLSVRVSGMKLRDKSLRIIALNDINRELDEKEIDSWSRLTRVLTHEIMNSITPVTSLSESLLALPVSRRDEELRQGLETICTTGKGLVNFVTSYRRLTRLPDPELALFDVQPFLERMIRLAKHQYPTSTVCIVLKEVQEDLMVYADENLLTQVLTNLLKNAIQAIGEDGTGEIRIRAFVDEQESVRIEVANNGPRITPEVAGQMFVPFFTTKEEGSGIGLSLSKQIMRLQGGSIALLPYQDEWTTFVVVL